MKYIANPVEVSAHKIVGIESTSGGDLLLRCSDGIVRVAEKAMLSRMVPAAGDYWVIQEDGYAYLNPKDVFERKYRRAED